MCIGEVKNHTVAGERERERERERSCIKAGKDGAWIGRFLLDNECRVNG